mmetsp:Transcript_116817/g.337508  ORF Transcript_116817/g.337508 Transcript_116817/m.337508 type:complete len:240 (+) Transcript_116817:947-1666(+)
MRRLRLGHPGALFLELASEPRLERLELVETLPVLELQSFLGAVLDVRGVAASRAAPADVRRLAGRPDALEDPTDAQRGALAPAYWVVRVAPVHGHVMRDLPLAFLQLELQPRHLLPQQVALVLHVALVLQESLKCSSPMTAASSSRHERLGRRRADLLVGFALRPARTHFHVFEEVHHLGTGIALDLRGLGSVADRVADGTLPATVCAAGVFARSRRTRLRLCDQTLLRDLSLEGLVLR